jgi:hypothetical protein
MPKASAATKARLKALRRKYRLGEFKIKKRVRKAKSRAAARRRKLPRETPSEPLERRRKRSKQKRHTPAKVGYFSL